MCSFANKFNLRLKSVNRGYLKIFRHPALYYFLILGLFGWRLYTTGELRMGQVDAIAIGGLVGCVELMGRYRHSPIRAILSGPAFFYVLINMLASYVAYEMLAAFDVFKDQTGPVELKKILTAGFGSLVFMRSSVFKIRVGDSDVGVGPAAILDTLLLVADRGVDRREAVARAEDVSALVAHVQNPRVVAKMLTKYSLALMQNVDEQTSKALGEAVGKIMDDPEIPDTIKMDIVALRLGIVVGPDVMEAAVAALGDRLNSVGSSTGLSGSGSRPPSPLAPDAAPARSGVPPLNELRDEIARAVAQPGIGEKVGDR